MNSHCVFQKIESTVPDRYQFCCVFCDYVHTTKKDKPPVKDCPEAQFGCRFRGEVKRREACNVCASGRGTIVEVFACEIHGECVKRQHRTPATVQDCVRCIELKKGWQPPTFPRVIQSDCGVTAVTSIAPNEKALDAVQSWQDAGLLVVAVQPRDELEKVKAIYGELVDYWLPTDQDARWQFGKPCVFIWDLASIAIEAKKPVMIINSDIEIHGSNETLISLADMADSRLVVGVRHNFHDWRKATLERHGLDVFFVNPEFADSLPRLPLCMGKPGFDYWLPKHAEMIGQKLEIFEEPIFYHRRHELNWTGDDWLKAFGTLQAAGYNFGITSEMDLRASETQTSYFRESLRMVTV